MKYNTLHIYEHTHTHNTYIHTTHIENVYNIFDIIQYNTLHSYAVQYTKP